MDAPWKSRTHTDHFIPLVISGYPSACAAMRAASIEPIEAPFIRHRREMARECLDQEPSFRYEISSMNSNGHSVESKIWRRSKKNQEYIGCGHAFSSAQ